MWIDGAETTRAATIEGYVEGAHDKFLDRMVRQSTSPHIQSELASFEFRFIYNPTFKSIYAMSLIIPMMMLSSGMSPLESQPD